jgi:uncharacterized protein (TIGR02147 family)
MPKSKKKINVFGYSDYRLFLKDYYESRKRSHPEFTYRYIAKSVGFKSAGHFTQILNGSINLSISMAASFAEFLKLGKKESEYFELLVRFNQAKSHAEKRRCFERMLKFEALKISTIGPDQYEYFEKWQYVAIRELLAYYPFKDNYAELAKKLKPSIPAAEAKKAVDLLLRLGLIVKSDDGIFRKRAPALSANPMGKSIAITNQALDTMRLAAEAIERFPKEQRNISGVAFSVSRQTFATIQEEVRNFRKRILDIAQADPGPESVYQFNVQLFPLTEVPEKSVAGEMSCDS